MLNRLDFLSSLNSSGFCWNIITIPNKELEENLHMENLLLFDENYQLSGLCWSAAGYTFLSDDSLMIKLVSSTLVSKSVIGRLLSMI